MFPPTQFTRSTQLPLIPIANLFDLNEASWQNVTKEAMENTEFDADGEDGGIDVDDMTRSPRHFWQRTIYAEENLCKIL